MDKPWLDALKLDVTNANNCSYTLTRDELYYLLTQRSQVAMRPRWEPPLPGVLRRLQAWRDGAGPDELLFLGGPDYVAGNVSFADDVAALLTAYQTLVARAREAGIDPEG